MRYNTLSARVNLFTDIKLKEKFGKFKTNVKGIDGVGIIVPDPRTHECDPSARVIVEGEDVTER